MLVFSLVIQIQVKLIVYKKRTMVVEESIHVTFDESNPSFMEKVVDNDADEKL